MKALTSKTRLKLVSRRIGSVSEQRQLFKKKLICATCDKKFTSIAAKGTPFPLECDKCWNGKFNAVTVFDRDSKTGKIPENLIRVYGIHPTQAPKSKRTAKQITRKRK